jgi:AcrR family transcriptional regulator
MTGRSNNRTKPAPRRRRESDQGTRARLLEAAGQVFAEKGFDRATGKEICERACTNTAAVNYHFGGIDGLYVAVIREARSRLITTEAVLAAVAGKADARAKLEAILELFARGITGPMISSWAPRVLAREMVAPSAAFAEFEQDTLTRIGILRSIVSELTGLPEEHPAVARGCVGVIGGCFPLFLIDRRLLRRLFPSLGLAPQDAPGLARHLLQFALAGLAAIARDARGKA